MKSNNDISSSRTEIKASPFKRASLFFAATVLFVLVGIFSNLSAMWVCLTLSASLFALFFASSPTVFILALLLPLAALLFTSGPVFTFLAALFLPIGISFSNSIKMGLSPADTVRNAFTAHILAVVVFVFVAAIALTDGSLEKLFNMLSGYLDRAVDVLKESIPKEDTEILKVIDNYKSIIKMLAAGMFLALELVCVCLSYFATVLISRLMHLEGSLKRKGAFDLRTSRLSGFIYFALFIISAFMPLDINNTASFTIAIINLYTMLTPLFVYIGIYYLVTKFKRERKRAYFLFFIIAISLFLSPVIIFMYAAASGAYYSASKANKKA